jgi:hypothetical protein
MQANEAARSWEPRPCHGRGPLLMMQMRPPGRSEACLKYRHLHSQRSPALSRLMSHILYD